MSFFVDVVVVSFLFVVVGGEESARHHAQGEVRIDEQLGDLSGQQKLVECQEFVD